MFDTNAEMITPHFNVPWRKRIYIFFPLCHTIIPVLWEIQHTQQNFSCFEAPLSFTPWGPKERCSLSVAWGWGCVSVGGFWGRQRQCDMCGTPGDTVMTRSKAKPSVPGSQEAVRLTTADNLYWAYVIWGAGPQATSPFHNCGAWTWTGRRTASHFALLFFC